MTEQELRVLVRQTIARHNERTTSPKPFRPAPSIHASHVMFAVPAGSDAEGPCLIEPAVPCTHCGYCRSYGH